MGFSWKNQIAKREKKLLYRVEKLAIVNPDFKAAHPELVRELETGVTRVEIKKYVKKIMDKSMKYGQVPKPSVIVKRMNRVV